MKKFILLIVILFSSFKISTAQWTEFNTYFPYSLFAVDFLNDQTGLAVGQQGSILRTNDEALTWEVVLVVPGIWFNSVQMVNHSVAYAVGTYNSIYKTTNGGDTWINQSVTGEDKHFRGVYATTANSVTAVGYAGTFYYTEDGGASPWIPITQIPYTMHSIAFSEEFNSDGKAIIAATDGRIYRRSGWSGNWSFVNIQQTLGVYDYLNSIVMLNPNLAVIVGNNGRILRSTNSGIKWTIIPGPTMEHLRDVDALWNGHKYILVAVGDHGIIIRSENGGLTWSIETMSPPTFRHFYGVSLTDECKGYIVGEVGTYAEAATFLNENLNVSITPISNIVPEKYSLEQNYPNPFNPVTTIKFSVPSSSNIKLNIFDITGRVVASLVDQKLEAGTYAYTFDAKGLNSGIYFYRIEGNNFIETKKMTLIK